MSKPHRQHLMRPSRNKFKELIDSLRTQTLLKQQISLPIQSQHTLEPHNTDIVPVTQAVISHSSIVLPIKVPHKEAEQKLDLSEIEESMSETEVETTREQIVLNQITDLLRPQQKLDLPKNEGRSGHIRHQRLTINNSHRQNILRYSKIPQNRLLTPSSGFSSPSLTPIKELDEMLMIEYWNNTPKINEECSIQAAYDVFSKLIEDLKVDVPSPTIKRYKNCVYFGTQPCSLYQGIIYYFQNKLYYGELSNGAKHGYGVEIDFNQGVRFVGNFERGKKNGLFCVQKERQNYEGLLYHGLYHGQGKLMTEDCVYIGQFQNGKKHGFGQDFFPKTGLRLKGCFKNGEFQYMNKNKVAPDPTSQSQLKSKPQKILVKSNSYDIDFQLQRSFKKQVDDMLKPKESPLTHQDSRSLFDIMTNTPKANKYDFSIENALGKLPKIRIEGIQTKMKEDPQVFEGVRKQPELTLQKRYNSHQHRSMGSSNAHSTDLEEPLGRHRLNTPIYRLK